jgi:hypothetical protein
MKTKKEKKVSGTTEPKQEKQKSTFTLFREKYPNGIGTIINMRAVLR